MTGLLPEPLEPPLDGDPCEALVRVVTGADPLELWIADDDPDEGWPLERVLTGALAWATPPELELAEPLPLARVLTAPGELL